MRSDFSLNNNHFSLNLFVYFHVNNEVVYLDYEDYHHHGPLLCSFQYDCIGFVFIFFSPNEQRAGGGGGALPDFFFFLFFPCSADHEREWPPCKVVYSGWQPMRWV